jgi:CMP-N-acetylneuraminic acid synthetase
LKFQVIIPARGGSKRFPRKNIQALNGIPLISHSILFALKTFPKENIWVNTDDQEIAGVAAGHGVNITYRPEELGSDTASTADVLFFQQELFAQNNIACDAQILLQATNPLRPENLMTEAIKLFENSGRNSLASFTVLNRKYGKIRMNQYIPENYKPGQRMQEIDLDYYENGLVYIAKAQSILNKEIITGDVFPFICNGIEAAVDIDEPTDMLFAEFLLKNKQIL